MYGVLGNMSWGTKHFREGTFHFRGQLRAFFLRLTTTTNHTARDLSWVKHCIFLLCAPRAPALDVFISCARGVGCDDILFLDREREDPAERGGHGEGRRAATWKKLFSHRI